MSPEFDNATNPSRSVDTESSSADSSSSGPDESSAEVAHSAAPHEGVAAAPAREPEQPSPSAETNQAPSNSGAPETPAPDSGAVSATSDPSSSGSNPPDESAAAPPSSPEPPMDPATLDAITKMESEGDTNPDLGNIPDGEISAEAMSQLIEQYPTPGEKPAKGKNPPPKKKVENEVVEGKVVTLNDLGVVVDIGGKKEGLIPASEFAEDALTVPPLSPGQTVEVEKLGEEKDGYALLSYQRPLRRATWKRIEAAFRAKETIEGTVTDLIKGGLVVDIGVRAFLPA